MRSAKNCAKRRNPKQEKFGTVAVAAVAAAFAAAAMQTRNKKQKGDFRSLPHDFVGRAGEKWHEFKALALFDLYNLSKNERAQQGAHIHSSTVEEIEARIGKVAKDGFSALFVADKPVSTKISCRILVESTKTPRIKFGCEAITSSCAFYRAFSSLRFISTTISIERSVDQRDAMDQIFPLVEGGLDFGGLKYVFVGGKNGDSKGGKGRSVKTLEAWFFAETGFPRGEDTSVQQLRNWLGNFGIQKDLKVNSRLALGFSPSEVRFSLRDEDISVIDDITNDGGKIMTDGCGYISVSGI